MIKVGISLGDPAGVSPEIIYKGLKRIRFSEEIKIFIIGESECFRKQGLRPELLKASIIEVPIIKRKEYPLGRVSKICGRASFYYFIESLKLIKIGEIDTLVTSPVSKEAIIRAGIDFQGHTEVLESFFKKKTVMLMSSPQLKVSLLTRHIPLKAVPSFITKKRIKEHIKILVEGLRKLYNIKKPCIGICSLNPHGGENIEKSEERIIKDSIKDFFPYLKGPYPSDTLFLRREEFDCIVSLYHDQALIPFKILSFDRGLNLTLGLDFVRTSPAHGVAYDIAGKNKASPHSFIYALKEAVRLSKQRRKI